MPDFFWRRRLRKQERQIILNLPNLPDDIDDNVFIALAAQAAEQDKKSGAYDEFMFSEDGFASMPFEDGVDEFLALQIERTPERQGRAELPHRLRIEHFKSVVEDRQRVADEAQAELEAVGVLLDDEKLVLNGTQEGQEGGNWKGIPPEVTSKSRHVSRRILGWFIFLLIAGVDFGVVLFSLNEITPSFKEALLFTFPAVGVQILFPHLVGRSIGIIQRKTGQALKEIIIAISIGTSWLLYVVGMSMLRMNLLEDFYKQKQKHAMPDSIYYSTFILTVFIMVGLGLWVLIRSMSDNPHEDKFSRLRFVHLSKQRKLRRALKGLAKAQALVANEQEALSEVTAQWRNRAAKYPILGESAKSTYRRAIVNQEGQPEFTTTYLPKDRNSKKQRRDNIAN
jgi:hypothetical protein